METKFIKVSVSEKKPVKGEVYFTYDDDLSKSTRLFDTRKKRFFGRTQPLEYLLEVPDREDEMREMLEKIIYAQFTSGVPLSSLNAEISKARDYLKQLKN